MHTPFLFESPKYFKDLTQLQSNDAFSCLTIFIDLLGSTGFSRYEVSEVLEYNQGILIFHSCANLLTNYFPTPCKKSQDIRIAIKKILIFFTKYIYIYI